MIRVSRVASVARNETSILSRDISIVILLFLMPLALILFLGNSIAPLINETFRGGHSVGADFTVPAYTVTFAFFQTGYLGYAFIVEHGWGTWDRLRASSLRPGEIVIGKVLPYAVISLGQLVLMLLIGYFVFDMHVEGSLIALGIVVLAIVAVVIGFSLAFVAVFRRAQQITTAANLGALVLAGIGGALVPWEVLPHWAQVISPVTPQYWSMKALRQLISHPSGIGSVAPNLIVLFGMSAGLYLLSLSRFRMDAPKEAGEQGLA